MFNQLICPYACLTVPVDCIDRNNVNYLTDTKVNRGTDNKVNTRGDHDGATGRGDRRLVYSPCNCGGVI